VEKSKLVPYFWGIIWVIGLIILLEISADFKNQIQQTSNLTSNKIPLLWYIPFSSVVIGFYISILLVKKWAFELNLPLLLCVSLPCILLSFGYPILATLSTLASLPVYVESSSISFFLLDIFSSDVIGIIAGLTIILSIFNVHLKSENHK
jgi:hypothetical protein